MDKKFDVVAFVIAISVSVAISILAAWVYNLDVVQIQNSGFFGMPMYFYIFFLPIGFPLYYWIRYFRANRASEK